MEKKLSMIRIMLLDEQVRNNGYIEDYEQKLADLPKGKMVYVKKKSSIYVYLSYRDEHQKNKSKYVGKIDSPKYLEMKDKLEERDYYKRLLEQALFEKKEIEICLKAGDKLYG